MSNENNPQGLPPEFQELPEGFDPERAGERYDGHGQQEQYDGHPHDPYAPHEQHHHAHQERYDQDAYGSYDAYGGQGGGWQPTPQGGEYDSEATAFFQLPSEVGSDAAPLEAPGHGYVPPMITPLTPATGMDPGAVGGWAPPWPEPAADTRSGSGEPDGTGQWHFQEAEPFTPSDTDSGEYPLPSGTDAPWEAPTAPPTLPGGAPAPWATLPGGAPAPWARSEPPQADGHGHVHEPTEAEGHVHEPAEAEGHAHVHEPTEADVHAHEPVPEPAAETPEPVSSAALPAEEAMTREPLPVAPPPGEPVMDAPATPVGTDASAATAPEPAETPHDPADAPSGADAATDALPTANEEHPPTSYVLRVNGTDRPVSDAWIGESLLYVLRERLGLAGAKDGCSQGECGACNVQVDGRLVASCLVPAATAAGSEVRTVEGLAHDGEPSDVQRALAACGAVQCGFCIPGMAMTVHDLLEGNHAPTELETRQALCGNLCRCSGYRGVLDAVREVVAERAASAAAAGEAAEHGEEARIPHQAPPGAGSVQIHPHDGGMA